MEGTPNHSSATMYMAVLMGVSSMDYMATFFSLPLLWGLLGGSIKTYGLILGLYSLARALFSPIFGLLSDKLGTKLSVIACLSLMVSGNILYLASTHFIVSFGDVIDDVESGGALVPKSAGGMALLIGARLLVGMGTASLSLVTSYMMQSATTDSEKVSASNKTRMAAMLGGIVGNTLTLGCFYIPHNTSVGDFMVNGFTVPILFCILCEASLLIGASFFVAPIKKSEDAVGLYQDPESKRILKQTVFLNVLAMFSSMALFIYFSQLVPIASSFYHVVDGISQLWHAFLPIMIGSLCSMFLTKKLVKSGVSQLMLMKGGVVIELTGGLFLFGWGGGIGVLFYIGGALFFMGSGVFLTGCRSILSRVIEKSHYVSTLMGWMYISSGLGTFIGSTLGSLFLDTETSSSTDCLPENDPFGYSFGCLELTGVNGLVGFLIAALCILLGGVFGYDYLQKKMDWDEQDEDEPLLLNQ